MKDHELGSRLFDLFIVLLFIVAAWFIFAAGVDPDPAKPPFRNMTPTRPDPAPMPPTPKPCPNNRCPRSYHGDHP